MCTDYEWLEEMSSVHTVGHYPAVKRKEILSQATVTNYEDIMPGEIRQS